ncbi:hypothetical protein J8273_8635 [Carpediemonas membranifera]|uniref:Uncharacterized protein n=1 Tax=Carpediemonas membranifera TaxID=201153 RepID=A0A8J6DYX4_9EUKA|nr:hypothetical protein J8273_8635 [Carpediemonas membranifera]|eukprot:KAG9389948.1 hypothetical protein J8273_8635 [Carpediemonas membranifera]
MSTLRKQQIMPSLHVVTKKISILSGEQFFDENTLWSPVDVQKRLEPFASFVAEAEASGRGVYIVFEANCLSPMLPHEIEFPLHAFLRLQAEIHKLSSSVPIRTMFTYDTRRIPTASLVGLMICCPSFVFNASYYQNPVYYPHQRIRLSALNSLFLNLWAHQVEASVPCSLVTTGRPPSVSPAATIQSLPTMPHSRQLSPLPADDEEGGEEDDEGWVTEDE